VNGAAQHVEDELSGTAGVALYWQAWLPEVTRAVAVVAHGGLEHGGRYAYLAQRLCSAGIAVYCHDFRGHGRSGGRRGQIDSMAFLVEDLHRVRNMAEARHPDVPVFVVAHSLGSLVALEYALDFGQGLRGAVLSGTGIDVSAVPAIQVRVARLLSRLAPNLPLVKFSGEGVSRDPEVVHDYATDPLNFHGRVPVRTPAELFISAERLVPRLGFVDVPLLILHGGADPVAAPAGARLVHDRAGSRDKSVVVYDGLRHEIFNEPERETVIADLLAWITERI
jgi:alpha-beta hydrolase superfamily lysophospholipase